MIEDSKKVFELLSTEKNGSKKESYLNHRSRVKKSMDLDEDWASKSDHDLLEYALFCIIRQKDTKPIARELINIFGSLSAVLSASTNELVKVDGVGEMSARLLSLVIPMSRRAEQSRMRNRVCIATPADAAKLVIPLFANCYEERIYLISIDVNDKVIQTNLVDRGDKSAADLSIPKVMNLVFRNGASRIIIAHNHPAGTLRPSSDDVDATSKLLLACSLINVDFLDHLIVGKDNEYFSFMQSDTMGEVYEYAEKVSNGNFIKEGRMRRLADRYILGTKEPSAPLTSSYAEMLAKLYDMMFFTKFLPQELETEFVNDEHAEKTTENFIGELANKMIENINGENEEKKTKNNNIEFEENIIEKK